MWYLMRLSELVGARAKKTSSAAHLYLQNKLEKKEVYSGLLIRLVGVQKSFALGYCVSGETESTVFSFTDPLDDK